MKVAPNCPPNVIKAAAKDINYIATNRINQIISHGVKEVERVLSKILHGTIVEVYQMPFRLLSNFGKQQQNKIKKRHCVKHTSIVVYFIYKDRTIIIR